MSHKLWPLHAQTRSGCQFSAETAIMWRIMRIRLSEHFTVKLSIPECEINEIKRLIETEQSYEKWGPGPRAWHDNSISSFKQNRQRFKFRSQQKYYQISLIRLDEKRFLLLFSFIQGEGSLTITICTDPHPPSITRPLFSGTVCRKEVFHLLEMSKNSTSINFQYPWL